MKLPSIKRILREDVKEAPPWVNGLIDPLNSFMETIYQALNRNLTFTENISSFVKELTYITPSTYPSNQEDVLFLNSLSSRPAGVVLLQIYDKDTYAPPTDAVYVPWTYTGTQVVIKRITGLTAGKSYFVRLLIL